MLIAAGPGRALGRSPSRLTFNGARSPGPRVLVLDTEPAFELSFWCGTHPFLFERLPGASTTLSIPELSTRLAAGLDGLDGDVIDTFAALLPPGVYLPLLLEVRPRRCLPSRPGDYFAEEQVATWGLQPFWGLPEYPHTAYYRTFQTAVTPEAHLFEFVVPMTPLAWDDGPSVAGYAELLQGSSSPTAVAVSTLDVCAPAMDNASTDYHQHWGLTHFLLDGHHKMHAAADTDRPLRLLSLLSVDGSLATPTDVARVPDIRARPSSPRPPPQPSRGPVAAAVGWMADPAELVDPALTEEERYLLRCGLHEWGGPARCTDAMAAAMGFTDVAHLLEEGRRLRAAVEAGQPLSRWDWSRVLLATEIVFASDVVGAGSDWSITTGLRDEDTIRVLRIVQRKLAEVTGPTWASAAHTTS